MKRFSLLSFLLASLLCLSSSTSFPDQMEWRVRIAPSSFLSITGTTNVNTFECISEQDYGRVWLESLPRENGTEVYFERAVLNLDVSSLECGHEAINRDLRTTLKSDQYPNIRLRLLKVRLPGTGNAVNDGRWHRLQARVDLTLAGNSCRKWIEVKMRRTGEGHYRVSGDPALAFSDFDLERPSAMMGLIKVDDIIEINFDLRLSVQPLG